MNTLAADTEFDSKQRRIGTCINGNVIDAVTKIHRLEVFSVLNAGNGETEKSDKLIAGRDSLIRLQPVLS